MGIASSRRVGRAWLSNCLCRDVLAPVFKSLVYPIRPRQSFGCQSRPRCDRNRAAGALVAQVAANCPCQGCIYRRSSRAGAGMRPNNHFAAGPDCCMAVTTRGALFVLVVVQLSVLGLICRRCERRKTPYPTPAIVSLPVTPRFDRLGISGPKVVSMYPQCSPLLLRQRIPMSDGNIGVAACFPL